MKFIDSMRTIGPPQRSQNGRGLVERSLPDCLLLIYWSLSVNNNDRQPESVGTSRRHKNSIRSNRLSAVLAMLHTLCSHSETDKHRLASVPSPCGRISGTSKSKTAQFHWSRAYAGRENANGWFGSVAVAQDSSTWEAGSGRFQPSRYLEVE